MTFSLTSDKTSAERAIGLAQARGSL